MTCWELSIWSRRLSPFLNVYVWRGTGDAMRGPSGVASDKRHGSNQPRLGASAEGRLAWPQAPSPSGHLCKPTRPQGPRVVFRRTPVACEHARREPFSDRVDLLVPISARSWCRHGVAGFTSQPMQDVQRRQEPDDLPRCVDHGETVDPFVGHQGRGF